MDTWGVRRTVRLAEELKRWRVRRGLSYRALAAAAQCEHSLLWKIEHGKAVLTREMAEACDQALDAGGALVAAWVAAQGSVRPAQLPAAAYLMGRDAELAALHTETRATRRGMPTVVAIDGPPGVGKTALALRWAHEIAETYVDGQLYADLRGCAPPEERLTVTGVLQHFLTAMGASVIPTSTTERAALYRSLLADRKVLVVLDDAAGVADIGPLLPATSQCAVVVTSRRPLPGLVASVAATRVTLQPLIETDAIALMSRVIGKQRVETEAAEVAAIARLCGNLPLALRIAAEHIATYPHRPVADLLAELIEEDRRVNALDLIDIRAVLCWSYHDLEPDAARLFRLLGLHRGPHLSVPAVTALAGIPRPVVRRLLYRLASVRLVEIDADELVRVPELIRAYARECAADENPEHRTAAVQRLTHWYLATLHAAHRHLAPHTTPATQATAPMAGVEPLTFTDDTAAAWLTLEQPNLNHIATMAHEHGPPCTASHDVPIVDDPVLADRDMDRDSLDRGSKPGTRIPTNESPAVPMDRPTQAGAQSARRTSMWPRSTRPVRLRCLAQQRRHYDDRNDHRSTGFSVNDAALGA